MKFVIAQMEHETNTFSPVPTMWESFGPQGPYIGNQVVKAMSGTRTPIGAFLDLARNENAEIVTPVSGLALPSGPVDTGAYLRFCDLILEEVAKGCQAIFLDLHGAMVVKGGPVDAEGNLLEEIRKIDRNVPIAVSLDLHANVSEQMVKNCSAIAGYRTYPHIDMYETGHLVGSILLRAIREGFTPTMKLQKIPILAQTLKMDTQKGAMSEIVKITSNQEHGDVLAATFFGGFPMADVPDAGMSVVVVTNARPELADSTCKKISDLAWEKRAEFLWEDSPLDESIRKAKQIKNGPVLLIDHADNCCSGGTQDTMDVVKEALEQGLDNIGVGPIRDPEAVNILVKAGIGAKVELKVGGKMNMPSIKQKGDPLMLSGIVKNITDGQYVVTGPQFTGMTMFMGKTVVFETKQAIFVLTEKLQEPLDIGVFTSVGLNPKDKHFLILKSRMYFKPIFHPIAKATIYCNGTGVTSSDWRLFQYEKVNRPIYPLDGY